MLSQSMRRALLSLLVLLCFAIEAIPQDNPDRVIASTKSWSITAKQFEAIVKALPEQAREMFAEPASRRKFLDDLIQMWVLADEARTKGFDQEAGRKAVIGFYTNNIVSSDYKDFLTD